MKIARVRTTALGAGTLALMLACGAEDAAENQETPATAAAVMITSPMNDVTVEGNLTLQLEAQGVEIKPAGTNEAGTGHHHLFIDRDISPVGEPIPTGDGIVHLGMAQTEYVFEDLAPGQHTIIAVLGDYLHVRLPNVATDTVRVTIAGT